MNLRCTPARRIVTLLASAVVAACSPSFPTDAPAQPDFAKGGRPGGGTTTGILPTVLGNLKLIGCAGSSANDLSSGFSPLVVGSAACGLTEKPFIWSASTGLAQTGDSPGKWALAVSDNGTIVGLGPAFEPVTYDMNGQPSALPLPEPYVYGDARDVTRDGLLAVGYMEKDFFDTAILWRRASSSAAWGDPEPIDAGRARGVAEGGTVVVGVSGNKPVAWRWVSGGWQKDELLGATGRALGITADGSVIVGEVDVSPPGNPGTYNKPMAWIRSGTGWVPQELTALDAAANAGSAHAVATQADGTVLAVGSGWEPQQNGGTWRALVWRLGASGTFGTPTRLEGLQAGTRAEALGVNDRGRVVGSASSNVRFYAVMWQLP